MSSKYYYLVASLPILEFGKNPPISYDDFLNNCRRILSEGDFKIISSANYYADPEPSGENNLFDAWAVFNRNFRNETVYFCCQKKGKDPSKFLRGEPCRDPFCAQGIDQASKSQNILLMERHLDMMKWQQLDEMLQGHHFDLDVLIVYALKLQILERHADIDSSKGRDVFEEYKKFEASEKDLTPDRDIA